MSTKTKAVTNGRLGPTVDQAGAGGIGRSREIVVTAPKFETATFKIVGSTPYMQNRFSKKAMDQIKAKHEAGSTNKKAKKEARDFDADYKAAMHRSTKGWLGIPAAAFRAAMISACRLVNFKMTIAKLSIRIEADGYDEVDGTDLVRIIGEPERTIMAVRNETGVADLRARPTWREWSATIRIRYDAEQFSLEDVTNLLARVGMQIGIGEGRPDSKASNGFGYGLFDIEGKP